MYSPYLASTTNFPFGIEVDRAEGTFIYDTKGKRYFDLIAGISVSNLGHQHPQIIKEIKKVYLRYDAKTFYHNNAIIDGLGAREGAKCQIKDVRWFFSKAI